jgi:predicted ABC-type exoprotein transport system permease subunit
MSNSVVGLLVALGLSAWIYSKVMKTTGNNTQSALTVSAISGVLIFIVVIILMGYLPD